MKGKKLSYDEKLQVLEEKKQERQRIFKELCKHVADGKSVNCFYYLTATDMKRMFEKYPEEFDQRELERAKMQGMDWWEEIGKRQANRTCLGNSRTWFYNMAHRYGWSDKVEIKAEHKGAVTVNVVNYGSQDACEDSVGNE